MTLYTRLVNQELDSRRLLALAQRLLLDRSAAELAAFLAAWPNAAGKRLVTPSAVPALRWLPRLQLAAAPFSAAFLAALVEAAPGLAWRRSYSVDAVGERFYGNYGWTELAGLTGPVPSQHLACGVLILGSDLTYPPHRHEAEEIYVPLAGTAEWQQGGGGWQAQAPGRVIHHASNEPHAMRTAAEPLLGLYLWRSRDLAQHSRLD